jgi:hypothetical protein
LTLLEADEAEAAAAAARDETINDWDIAVAAWRPKGGGKVSECFGGSAI